MHRTAGERTGGEKREGELMEEIMCPQCQQEGRQSQVYPEGTTVTDMCVDEFYDETGRHHWHNPNGRSTSYHCRNGHEWGETRYSTCWCGEGRLA